MNRKYCEYNEQVHALGYLSYQRVHNPISLFPAPAPSDLEKFQKSLSRIKAYVFSKTTALQRKDSATNALYIQECLQQHPELSAWCHSKCVVLEKIKDIDDLPVITTLLAMMEIQKAKLSLESITLFIDILGGLKRLGLTPSVFFKSVRVDLVLNIIHSAHFSVLKMSENVKDFFALLTDESYTSSADFFHCCCANELHQIAAVFIEGLLKKDKTCCDQFFTILDSENKTPLIAATLYGINDVAKRIINASQQAGINVQLNAVDRLGKTALDYALILGRTELVIALLKAGASHSSHSIISLYQDEACANQFLKRALLCGDRHFKAHTNYFYFQNSEHHLPIMYKEEPAAVGVDSSWKFVVKHPDDPEAIRLFEHHSDQMIATCKSLFMALREESQRYTYKEYIALKKKDPLFLIPWIQTLVRLGMYKETVYLLEQNHPQSLLRSKDGINLLVLCTNSFETTSKFCNLTSRSIEQLLQGRLDLVNYFCINYPDLIVEPTKTSVGLETFVEIVQRMEQKPPKISGINKEVSFNQILYSTLKKACYDLKLIGTEQATAQLSESML